MKSKLLKKSTTIPVIARNEAIACGLIKFTINKADSFVVAYYNDVSIFEIKSTKSALNFVYLTEHLSPGVRPGY